MIVNPEQMTLEELPAGSLFMHGETIGLKTEYRTDTGAIEAYIVGGGCFFWGGCNSPAEQVKLKVFEIISIK